MKDLVGRSFALAEGRYRIVDARRVGTHAMVYAEALGGARATASAPGSQRVIVPGRTAFHYLDIVDLLETSSRA